MKALFTLFLSILISYSLFSQQPFPLEFDKGKTVWQRLVTNSDKFVPGGNLDRYNSIFPIDVKIVDSFAIALYATIIKAVPEGLMLEKFNYKTGRITWQTIDNYYTGSNEYEFFNGLFLRDDGDIEVTGMRAKEKQKGYSPFVSKKVFSYETGKLLEYVYDTLSEDNYDGFSRVKIYPSLNDTTHFGAVPYADTGLNPKLYVRFYALDKNLRRFESKTQDIKNDPDPLDSFTIAYVPLNPDYGIFNDHILGCIYFHLSAENGKNKPRAEIVVVDYTNPNNMVVKARKKFGDVLYDYPDEKIFYSLKGFGDQLGCTFRYPIKDTVSGKFFRACSYLVFDTLGNLIINVADISKEGHFIYHSRMLGKNNDNHYLLGKRSDNRAAFDLYEVDINGNVRLLTTIITKTREDNDGLNGADSYQQITPDNYFIFSSGLYTKKGNTTPKSTSTMYTMCFDLNAIITAVSDLPSDSKSLIKLFPNPTSNVLNLLLPEAITGNVAIHDLRGQELLSFQLSNDRNLMLSVGELPIGEYFINVKKQGSEDILYQSRFTKIQ
jgi:Secretion system C-terminal sorting domain